MTFEVTQEKTERQKEIEKDSVILGAARYRGMSLAGEQRALQSAADQAPGKALMTQNIEAIAELIGLFIEASESGKAGRKHAALPYLAHVDHLQAAYIALRMMVNNAGTGLSNFTSLARKIGIGLQEHLEMLAMAKDHPGLYRKLSIQLARSTSSTHRLGVIRHVRQKYALASLKWSDKDKILVGSKLIELVMDAMPGIFEIIRESRRRHNTPIALTMTEEALGWLEDMHKQCELLSPIYLPMIVPPRKWRTPYSGGYLTGLLKPRLVRTKNRNYLDELGGVDLSRAMAAVNAIQETPWTINKAVLAAIREEQGLGGGSAGLPTSGDRALPPLPPGIPQGVRVAKMTASQREDMVVWKAKAAKIHAENAKARIARVALAQQLYVAERFAAEEAIYFPHFLDFRGRVYPMPSYLNPQSDDVGRALLQFAEGKPLGEDGAFWLAVHLAGLWGVDKVSFEDRVAWTEENSEKILASALSPHEDGAFWREADKPFQALAACFDWLGYQLNGNDHVSHLPIAMDGSCSGLQHYSALLRDEVGGAAVNLVPAEKPADVYTQTAIRAQALSDSSHDGTMSAVWRGKVGRKITKQPTMTLCYSATKFGMKQQIENALKKLDEDGPYLPDSVERHAAALYIVEHVWNALGDTVVAADRAMTWLKKVAEVTVKAGIPLRWTSPIGFPVLQDYKDLSKQRLEVHIGGRRIRLDLKVTKSGKFSVRRQTSGVAPNFVHSLDASHLLSTVSLGAANGLSSFAVVHDSFAVHASDTTLLNAVLRESFVDQYKEPVLERFRDEIAAQIGAVAPELLDEIPPLPKTGTLDLDAVKDSEFFFA